MNIKAIVLMGAGLWSPSGPVRPLAMVITVLLLQLPGLPSLLFSFQLLVNNIDLKDGQSQLSVLVISWEEKDLLTKDSYRFFL